MIGRDCLMYISQYSDGFNKMWCILWTNLGKSAVGGGGLWLHQGPAGPVHHPPDD